MIYKDYLKSQDWEDKRELKYSKSKKRCAICSSTQNLDLHHLNYKNLTDVNTTDLRILCRRCHTLTHQLFQENKIVFKNTNHHSRFAIIKSAVKKELNISAQNLFYPDL